MDKIMDESDIARRLSDTEGKLLNLAAQFCYYTECQMATLEQMQMVASTPKSRLKRQTAIVFDMVNICANYNLQALGPQVTRRCPSLCAELKVRTP